MKFNFTSKVYFILIAALVLFSAKVSAQGNFPFKVGEKLSYVINYRWGSIDTDVGEANVELKYDNGLYHPIVTGSTYKFWDVFFKVRELFESQFRVSDGRPVYFHRNTREGKYNMLNTMTFNNSNYEISCTTQKNGGPIKDSLIKATSNTYDLVSLFYKVRCLDFSKTPVGVRQPISFVIDREIYDLYYIYKGEFIKKFKGLGTFKVLKFNVMVVTGEVFSGKDELTIYVTNDDNKIPLLFESPILVGKVYGRLTTFSNLRYPLTSKIK
jgi:hypothetical protein